jgi:hypothetical protein
MPSFKSAFPSKYLKAQDCAETPTLTIKKVAFEDVGQGADVKRKLVASFVERDQRLVLNVTNATTIAELLGSEDYDTWGGRRIKLIASRTTYQGKATACVRIERPAEQLEPVSSDLGF